MIKELVARAKQGDKQALQQLRDSGYFARQKARKSGYATSHAQRRLWVLCQMEGTTGAYNIPQSLMLTGVIDVTRLQRALDELVARHDGLRTRFAMRNGELRQFVADEVQVGLQQVDLQHAPDPTDAARQLLRDDALAAFDLESAPLLRVKLLQLAAEQHILYINIHHIVADGWSLELLMGELIALYAGSPLPTVSHQYSDFARWQNKLLAQDDQLQAFWHGQLDGTLPILDLPTDSPRPSRLTYSGGSVSRELSADLTQSLHQLARQQRTTLFTILTACVKIFLHRYTGQEEIIVGTPSAGRDDARWQNVVGFLINTLPLRDQIVGEDSLLAVIGRVRETILNAYAHQNYPFDKLVEELDVARDQSRNPLFDVLVQVQNRADAETMLGDVQVAAFAPDVVTAKFDLTFDFVESAENIHLHLIYNSDLFRAESAERMATNLVVLLESLVAEPESEIATLRLLSEAEATQLATWNDTAANYPADATITSLFAEQVAATPDNIAVIFGDTQLTYRELDERSNAVAAALQANGVNAGETVAIFLGRSHQMIVAILGVLKAGGIYVPVDPEYPTDRIAYMIEDCGTNLVLTDTVYAPQLNTTLPTLDIALIHHSPFTIHRSPFPPSSPAYIIYTSGSTGQPKGCVVTHQNVVRLMKNDAHPFAFDADDVWVVAHSFCFDFSVWEMYGALLYGGRVVVAERETVRDPVLFLDLLVREGVTVLNQTPAAFYGLISADLTHNKSHTIHTVIFGGDRLDPTYLRDWTDRYPQVRLVNMYGITETTVHVTHHTLTEADIWGAAGRSPIGKPLPETEVHILNPAGQPQPIGVVGEIYVGGSGVSKGYLNKPKLTEDRYSVFSIRYSVDDLLNTEYRTPNTIYRSGDLGRWLPDGTLEHLGRNDFQVQLRGFRIELGEIEAVIVGHPSVEKCVVIARGTGAAMQLVAYAIGDERARDEIWARLREKLATYMVPSALLFLAAFPLTSNGKIDRKALPEPDFVAVSDSEFVAPRTDIERQVATIWAEELAVARVGIEDDFFALGGHSLKATRVVARMQGELGIELRLRDLFDRPKIIDLPLTQSTTQLAPISPVPAADHYPLSHAQRRLWLLKQMGVESSVYNIPLGLWLNGDLDVGALARALGVVVQRHEALRTTFVIVDDEPRQQVHAVEQDWLHIVDLRERSDYLAELVQADAGEPFDFATFPLFRATLYRLSGKRNLLFFNIHHIIADGWSLDLLLSELLQLYANPATQLQPLRIQYKDYAVWQNEFLANAQAQRDFWHAQLDGDIPVLDLPTDSPRPTVQTFAGAEIGIEFTQEESAALLRLGREHGATAFMTVLALTNVLLHRYTGQDDLIVGSPIAGRDHPDLAGQVGFFVNMLPLRQRVDSAGSFVALLKQVGETIKAAFEHQQYPFDLLVGELGLQREMGRSPLFDVAVSLQSLQGVPADVPLHIAPYDLETTISKWEVTFFYRQAPDGRLSLLIEYNSDLFEAARMARMGGHLRELARSAVQTPHRPISRLNLLGSAEKQHLQTFNHTTRPYPADQPIAALFAAQAAAAPDAIAVRFADRQLSYRELDALSNRLAHTLRDEYTIQPNEPVGVLLDRSEWTIIALLGILKAGGCYLPFDPVYPPERIAYMIEDTACRVILSEPKQLDRLPTGGIDVRRALSENECALPFIGNGESLAYIIYTSGSTGRPKGTLIPQRGVTRLVCNTDYITLDETSRILQTGSLAFDASTFEIWGALLNGGCVCLPAGNALLDAQAMGNLIRQHAITDIFITTSLFNQLVEADVSIFADVRTVLSGGEKVSVGHFNRLRDAFPDLNLLHVYGPTENTTFSSYYPVHDAQIHDIPIGYPIANSTIEIVDKHGQPVPVGVAGEIWVGGDGVGLGYLNRPKLTSERFVQVGDKSQLYKTGDLGMWLSDGAVRFIGRIDNQLKVRGFRVEPGEIEQTLLAHPDVLEAVVLPRTTSVGTKELLGYFVGEVVSADLRTYLAEKLPSYMVPAHLVQLEQFTLNRSGKIDRSALPEPERAEILTHYHTPRTTQEAVLAAVWQDVLNLPQVDIHDNYFEIGGDSIRAIQITSRLLRQGWKLEIQDLFLNPTIAELGGCVVSAEIAQTKAKVTGNVPLTPIQTWFFAEQTIDVHHFNQAILLQSPEQIDETALRTTLDALMQQHDMLRTVYRDGQQTILGEMAVDFAVIETDDIAPHVEQAHCEFELASGSLLRARLLRLPTEERLLLVAHHLVVDGVSWRILLEDLEIGYAQAMAGQLVDLGGKTASFQQWSEVLRDYTEAGTWRDQVAVWQGLESPDSQATPYGESTTLGLSLSEADTTALLQNSNHAYHTEINDLLLTALGRALQWQMDMPLVMLEGHGREPLLDLDVSRTVGWFTSLYPFSLELTDYDIGAQIKEVKERLRRLPNKGFDYGVMRFLAGEGEEIRPKISFNYLGQFDNVTDGFFNFAPESSGIAISPNALRVHEIDIIGIVGEGRLSLSVTVNPDEQIMAEQLLADFEAELLAVIAHCQQQVESEMTASDFTADISADDLSSILSKLT